MWVLRLLIVSAAFGTATASQAASERCRRVAAAMNVTSGHILALTKTDAQYRAILAARGMQIDPKMACFSIRRMQGYYRDLQSEAGTLDAACGMHLPRDQASLSAGLERDAAAYCR